MSYVQGFVLPVPADKKEAYRQAAADFSSIAKEFGATRQVEAWGDDVPDGKLTDFKGAVKAKPDEIVVFSWLEYPSKEVADALFKEVGAIRVVETWGEKVPDGKVTDYKGAVKATADEKIVYSWVEWPSKAVRDEGWKKMMADERMKDQQMPFDGKRLIYGGFAPIFDA